MILLEFVALTTTYITLTMGNLKSNPQMKRR